MTRRPSKRKRCPGCGEPYDGQRRGPAVKLVVGDSSEIVRSLWKCQQCPWAIWTTRRLGDGQKTLWDRQAAM